MDDRWVYPEEVREWLSDFGGETDDPLALGTPRQMETFLDECERAVDYYQWRKKRESIDYSNTKIAIKQCETLIATLEKDCVDDIELYYEDNELRKAQDLLESLVLRSPPITSKPGRPEKTDELVLVGQMANAYLRFLVKCLPNPKQAHSRNALSKH